MIPDIIPNGTQLLTDAGVVAALGPQFSLQHIVFDAQLRAVSSTVQMDDPGGRIEMQVDTSDDDVPADGSGLAFVRAAPIEQSKAQHKFHDLALLAHLCVHAEELGVDRLDSFTAAVLGRPDLPRGSVALVGVGDFVVLGEVMFNQRWIFTVVDLGIQIGH